MVFTDSSSRRQLGSAVVVVVGSKPSGSEIVYKREAGRHQWVSGGEEMRRTSTIQDVARVAGVSTATVSRALSNPGLVAEATRGAVLEAVQKTGFRLNHVARNLRRQRTGSVIALVPNLANPFFSQILSGIACVLTPASYGLLVADTRTGPGPEGRFVQYLSSGVADGLILFDGGLSPACLDVPGRPPVIAACEWLEASLPSVRVENTRGAAMAVGHLVEMGHRAIGHLAGPERNVLTGSRRRGFLDAMEQFGLPVPPDWLFEGDFSLGSGAQAAERWLTLDRRPTALFCASDEMACGFTGAVQRTGIDVPGAVSVIGFDDIDVAAHLTPALTTIRQPRRLIGERAATLLIEMIRSGEIKGRDEVIPVDLIRRDSVAVRASGATAA
jgi:LacI family transcriptional regulator, repressor for deo operon, udp, cdd, tsx, nupC, and nupG